LTISKRVQRETISRDCGLLLGGLISLFTGAMICLIVLLDNPFRGEVGVSPQAFELIYSQMMSE
jgi:hypothetical protein